MRLLNIDALKGTVERFKYAAACAVLLFLSIFAQLHFIHDKEVLPRFSIALGAGYFWFVSAKLFKESGFAIPARYRGWEIFIFLLLLIFILCVSSVYSVMIFLAALLLSVSVAPYLIINDNLSFWFFNKKLWQGAAIAGATGIIFAFGVNAIIASVLYLFHIQFYFLRSGIYGDVFAFAFCVLAALYAFAWIPDRFFYTAEDCRAPRQLSFCVNWVLTPLVLIYLAILYIYFFQIVVTQDVPRNMLAYMITAFGVAGVGVYMAGYPLATQENAVTRFFYKIFFPALLIPACVMFYAIAQRIMQYGVTEDRYMIALAAFWFTLCSLVFSYDQYRKINIPLKFIPLSLVVLLLLACVGPWSASNLSQYDQLHRLEKVMNQYGILKNGKIGPADTEVSFEDRKQISSILDYINRTKKQKALEKWLPAGMPTSAAANTRRNIYVRPVPQVRDITKLMGFDYVSRYQKGQDVLSEQRFSFSTGTAKQRSISVHGYDYYFENSFSTRFDKNYWFFAQEAERPAIHVYVDHGKITLKVGNGDVHVFDLTDTVAKIKVMQPKEDRPPFVLESKQGHSEIKMYINGMNGNTTSVWPVISTIKFSFLLKMK